MLFYWGILQAYIQEVSLIRFWIQSPNMNTSMLVRVTQDTQNNQIVMRIPLPRLREGKEESDISGIRANRFTLGLCVMPFVAKETLVTIQKAVDASPELRSKKELIETFIDGINDVDDVMLEWRSFVAERKGEELETIIKEEKLKPDETRKFIEASMQAGEIRTVGTDIDKLMPPVSRFGGGNRAAKKQNIIERLKTFFEKFFGIG